MCIVVVQEITPNGARGKADTVERVEGRSPDGVTARRAGHHRGLRRAEHVVTGGTRERGRASRLLVITAGRAGVPADQEPWRWWRASGCQRARQGTQSKGADKVWGSERKRSDPRGTAGSSSGAQYQGRWGTEAQGTHRREGDAGQTVLLGG
jgi:hypothetical protein